MMERWNYGKFISVYKLSVIRMIGATFFLSILSVPVHALSPDQVFDKVKDSVVVVKTLGDKGKVKIQGSGKISTLTTGV